MQKKTPVHRFPIHYESPCVFGSLAQYTAIVIIQDSQWQAITILRNK